MAKITEFLKIAKKRDRPDQRYVSLMLTSPGLTLGLEAPDAISEPLFQAMNERTKNALIGSWWESEWKICPPAAQLTAEQIDARIESLVFRSDGRISVTWRGGGAESPG
jgi:hypothetical protein